MVSKKAKKRRKLASSEKCFKLVFYIFKDSAERMCSM